MTTVPCDEQAIAILNEMFAGLSDRHRKIMSEVAKSSMAMARTYVAMEREACAKMLDDLAREARTARDNYMTLGNAGMDAQRHDNRASAYAAGAANIRARGDQP